MDHIISVNKDRCIGCGRCVKDCPESNIKLENKKAKILGQNCMKCGHCVAICPTESVNISGFKEDSSSNKYIGKIDSKTLLNAIKFRRSIRDFKDEEIPKYIIEDIINAGRWTPTAKNRQDVSYIIIDRKMEKVEKEAVKYFRKLVYLGKILKKSLKEVEIDDDFFFKKAPIAIAVISKDKINASLAASNMALMAESHDLGVLYSGFFSSAANKSKKIQKILGLKNEKIVNTLVIGYPNVKYHRNPPRKQPKVKYK